MTTQITENHKPLHNIITGIESSYCFCADCEQQRLFDLGRSALSPQTFYERSMQYLLSFNQWKIVKKIERDIYKKNTLPMNTRVNSGKEQEKDLETLVKLEVTPEEFIERAKYYRFTFEQWGKVLFRLKELKERRKLQAWNNWAKGGVK